jgi:hypothetical protein
MFFQTGMATSSKSSRFRARRRARFVLIQAPDLNRNSVVDEKIRGVALAFGFEINLLEPAVR